MIDPRDAERARAILGVRQGATPDELRSRHRELVKQWHPDRFATDPQGQAEATVRMRAINAAYQLLSEVSNDSPGPEVPFGNATRAQPGSRLSKEQIDYLVASIGNDSLVEALLDSLPTNRLGLDVFNYPPVAIAFATAALSLAFIDTRAVSERLTEQSWIPLSVGLVTYAILAMRPELWSRLGPPPPRPYWTWQRWLVVIFGIVLLWSITWIAAHPPKNRFSSSGFVSPPSSSSGLV